MNTDSELGSAKRESALMEVRRSVATCATRRAFYCSGTGASRRGRVAGESKRSTWGDVEGWRFVATRYDVKLRSFTSVVNLNGCLERLPSVAGVRASTLSPPLSAAELC